VTITYAIDLDQENAKWSFNEPTNAKWVKSEKGAIKTLTFSDEVPVPVDMGQMFSPFLATWWNIQDQDAYRKDEGLRQLFVLSDFGYTERCRVHFERGNWQLFDKELQPRSGKPLSVTNRLIDLYNAYTAGFSKFTLNGRGRHDRVRQRLTLARNIEPKLYKQLAAQLLASGVIRKLWHEIAAIRCAFIEIYPQIQSLLQMRYWRPELQDLGKFKISDKKFNELRQLYIDCFETLCRLMVVTAGIETIIHYQELLIPTRKGKMSLDEFGALPNASKVIHLQKYPINDLFVPALDTAFRNSIGHHSAHYDASNDSVTFYDSKNPGVISRTMSYTEFCDKVVTLFAAFELAAMYHHSLHIYLAGRFS
jgi:hypothetical protein